MDNWNEIKLEYITGNISLRALAEKYDVPENTVMRHSKLEGWVAAKRQHASKIVAKAASKIATKEANVLVRIGTTADRLLGEIERSLEDTEQLYHYIVPKSGEEGTEYVEREYNKLDSKALRDYTVSLRELTTTMRSVFNLPTIQEQEAMAIARERLVLDKAKAAQGVPDDGDTGVVMLPPVQPEPEQDSAQEDTDG